jgi:hypothetical protein
MTRVCKPIELSGFLEFGFGGVAEGVEDAGGKGRNWKLESRNWKAEIRNWKFETRRWKIETRN